MASSRSGAFSSEANVDLRRCAATRAGLPRVQISFRPTSRLAGLPKAGRDPQLVTPLEHIPKKLIDFFDQNMLQLINLERVLVDWMIPSNRNAL
jgi:hypothetical protein